MVRPRGWHLDERHLLVDGAPVVGRARRLRAVLLPQRGRAARAAAAARTSTCPRWRATSRRGSGTTSSPTPRSGSASRTAAIRATVLIETIPAAFEMEEILYELRDHATRAQRRPLGLPVQHHQELPGRRARVRAARPGRGHDDRADRCGRTPSCWSSTCHRRGAFAIGGMAAFIPSRRDAEVNERALAKVREDKEREAGDGFDGSWVAHPDLVPVCREVFDARPRRPAQPARPAARRRAGSRAEQLLDVGARSPGARDRGRAARQRRRRRSATWPRGCAATARSAIHNLMEDAATAEISRSQIWQWVHDERPAGHRRDGHRRAGPPRSSTRS